MDKVDAVNADVASLSNQHLHSLDSKGGSLWEFSTPKVKVGLQGKGEREGAMPLATTNLSKATGLWLE